MVTSLHRQSVQSNKNFAFQERDFKQDRLKLNKRGSILTQNTSFTPSKKFTTSRGYKTSHLGLHKLVVEIDAVSQRGNTLIRSGGSSRHRICHDRAFNTFRMLSNVRFDGRTLRSKWALRK